MKLLLTELHFSFEDGSIYTLVTILVASFLIGCFIGLVT
jgi:hypothetical protein